jgi:hypothetical protein
MFDIIIRQLRYAILLALEMMNEWTPTFWKNKYQWKKSLYCWHKKKFRKKYLRQPSIDFDFCNISSSCDAVYKGRWLTQAGYWFI